MLQTGFNLIDIHKTRILSYADTSYLFTLASSRCFIGNFFLVLEKCGFHRPQCLLTFPILAAKQESSVRSAKPDSLRHTSTHICGIGQHLYIDLLAMAFSVYTCIVQYCFPELIG